MVLQDITEVDNILKKYNLKNKNSVLDVGSLDVNGTIKNLFENYNSYIGVDLVAGKNVDIVLVDQYTYNFIDNSFDVVISCNCLEHTKNPFKVVTEMVRVLKKDGYIILVVPFVIREHRHPIDCFRILPDGMRSLFEENNVEYLESYIYKAKKHIHMTIGIGKKI